VQRILRREEKWAVAQLQHKERRERKGKGRRKRTIVPFFLVLGL
jgi:hypothetical protein